MADADVDAGTERVCPLCETPLYERHCKYICPNHGAIMDCSDTFWN
ncbi:MAG: HVO_2523 family zinc finger protein [Halobacteriales archaeon]